MTILDAMRDPQLFGPWFADRASWRPWETFLAALFGLPSDEDSAAALFSQHTGRTVPPTQPGTALQPAVCVHTGCVLSAHAFGEPTHLAAGLTNWQPGMTS